MVLAAGKETGSGDKVQAVLSVVNGKGAAKRKPFLINGRDGLKSGPCYRELFYES